MLPMGRWSARIASWNFAISVPVSRTALNFAGCVCDRTRDRKHPFAIAPIAHGIADCDRLAAEGLLEIVAVADIVARSGGRSDVLAIGTDDGDVGYEAGELRLKS